MVPQLQQRHFCFCLSSQLFKGCWWRCRKITVATCVASAGGWKSDDAGACAVRLWPRHWRGAHTCVWSNASPDLFSSQVHTLLSWTLLAEVQTNTDVTFNSTKKCMKCLLFWEDFEERVSSQICAGMSETFDWDEQCLREITSVLEKSLLQPTRLQLITSCFTHLQHLLEEQTTCWQCSTPFKLTFPCYFWNSCNKLWRRLVLSCPDSFSVSWQRSIFW